MSGTAAWPDSSAFQVPGRYLVYFRDLRGEAGAQILHKQAGIQIASGIADGPGPLTLQEGQALLFGPLGVALVQVNEEQSKILKDMGLREPSIVSVEPERILHKIPEIVSQVSEHEMDSFLEDNGNVTWGLRTTNVEQSAYGGKEIGIAVLDTGLDFKHPDFQGRDIFAKSFVKGEEAQVATGMEPIVRARHADPELRGLGRVMALLRNRKSSSEKF